MSNHDDETWEERRRREARERLEVLPGSAGFVGTIEIADRVNGNGVSYSKECLEGIAETFKKEGKPQFGVMYDPSVQSPPALVDAAFLVKGMEVKDNHLVCEGKPIFDTMKGALLAQMLELEVETPGTFSMGMAVHVGDEDYEKDDKGVMHVKRCVVDRVSLLQSKEKA